MKATKITRVIGVENMRRAVDFYQTALGLTTVRESDQWSDLTCGDGNLSLQAYRPPEPKIVHTMVIFTVDDLDAAIASVEAAGGSLGQRRDNEHAPVLIAHVLDTEGNVIQLAQPKDRME